MNARSSRLGALVGSALLAAVAWASAGSPAWSAPAHAETDVIAAPAGGQVTVSLRPTHGCDGSPTTVVTARIPVAGATAGDVSGWTAEAGADGEGRTVVQWKDGSLPADEKGAFPVTFTVPDTPGKLVLLPFLQGCENGDELSWIDGDPAGDYPAPRLLVLAAGAEPADSLDELPPDTPGLADLSAVVDVDNPTATTGSSTTATSAPDTAESTTTEPGATTTVATTTNGSDTTGSGNDDEGFGPTMVILLVISVAAAAAAAVVLTRRRRQT